MQAESALRATLRSTIIDLILETGLEQDSPGKSWLYMLHCLGIACGIACQAYKQPVLVALGQDVCLKLIASQQPAYCAMHQSTAAFCVATSSAIYI